MQSLTEVLDFKFHGIYHTLFYFFFRLKKITVYIFMEHILMNW